MVRVAFLALAAGCSFNVPATPRDAPDEDSGPDARIDAPIDTPPNRVTAGLIGFWTFDDPNDTQFAADTSGAVPPVPLEVIRTVPTPTFAGGVLNAEASGRLVSLNNTRLASECTTANAVTLEVWVKAKNAQQGTQPEPYFIAGLAGSISARNVALMQGGNRWLAQVRSPAADGKPNLVSVTPASTTEMTHVVVVADGSTRALVINGVVEDMSTPGSLSSWDLSYAMTVADEFQHARQWLGSVALVALYKRALTTAEIQQNFAAGANH